MNKMLYDQYIEDNPKDKNTLDKCLKYADGVNKELYNFTVNDCKEMFNNFDKVEMEKCKNVCEKYIDKAINDYYTDSLINVFSYC